jgi:hypothetical protein
MDPRRVWDDVAAWIESCSTPPAGYLDLEVAYAFHTHIADRSIHSPILSLVGPPEYGKTRQGKAIVYVARRGVWTDTPRESHILRYATAIGATLFLDLWSAWNSIQRTGIEDIVLHRFEQGAKVARINDFKAGPFRDTQYYTVYGPTILASNTSLPPVLMSRCLTIPMRQSAAKPPRYPVEQDALPLRAALIGWRANASATPLPHVDCRLGGRLADIALPLLQVTQLVAPDRMGIISGALEEMRDERYQRSAETWEGRVVSALGSLYEQVENGLLQVRLVSEKANEGYRNNQQLDERNVSDVLRSLGFKTKPYGHDRRAHMEYEEALVRDLTISLLGRVGGGE